MVFKKKVKRMIKTYITINDKDIKNVKSNLPKHRNLFVGLDKDNNLIFRNRKPNVDGEYREYVIYAINYNENNELIDFEYNSGVTSLEEINKSVLIKKGENNKNEV
jgi:capsule polysaccharide modification protein KpsS